MRQVWVIFRERPLKGVLFLAIVGWLAISLARLAQPGGPAAPMPGKPGLEPARSERVAEIQRLRYSDPNRALELIRDVQAHPVSVDEREDAESLLGEVLGNRFYANKEAGRFEAAQTDLKILAREAPDAYQLSAMRQDWGEHLKTRWRHAASAGAEDEADRLAQQILKEYIADDKDFLVGYQKDRVGRWKRASIAGDTRAAEQWLLEAAHVLVTVSANSGISRELRESPFRGEELYVYARRLEGSGKHVEAIPFYQAALRKLDLAGLQNTWTEGRVDFATQKSLRRELERRLVDAFVRVADAVLRGEAPAITTFSPVDIYDGAIQSTREELLRFKPRMRKLEYQVANFYRQVAPIKEYDIEKLSDLGYLSQQDIGDLIVLARKARRKADIIMCRTAVEAWRAQLADSDFDPWPLLAEETIARVDDSLPDNATEDDRRRQLVFAARKKAYVVPYPQMREVQEHLWRVYARWGIFHLRTDRIKGFNILRPVLRGTTNTELRRALARTLRNLILKYEQQKDHDALYQVAEFYDAEIGIGARQSAFRATLKSSLLRTVAHFEGSSERSKAVLACALLGDLVPDEAGGSDARRRTIDSGYELVATRQVFTETGDYNPGSDLDGLSVIVIDNDTEQTLLCLYRGRETFYVRCRPYRRGCVVLRDGDYELAVLTATDKIIPYREQLALSSEIKKSVYRVDDVPRGGRPSDLGARVEYTLLRAPEGLDGLRVHPRTGAVHWDPGTPRPAPDPG